MALNTIGYDGRSYSDQDIETATGYRKSVIVGDELPYDTFEAEVWDYANALLLLADSGPSIAMVNADGRFMVARMSTKSMTDYTYGAPVTWKHRGKVVLRQFLESVKRTGRYKFLLSCVSGIGLLAKIRHYGGLYSNIPFSTVLADIIGGTFPYTVDSDVASIAVYGWLPVDNRRNNLRKLLTASGVIIMANADGSVRFAGPDTTSPASIADQDIHMGGDVDYPTPYRAVKITEHAFAQTANDILTTLLDGEAVGSDIVTPKGLNVTGAIVTFSDPMHDLAVTGTTILESGVNYAVLAPSTSCTLTGYKYSHTTRVVAAGSMTASEQATKRLDDCALINILNSEAVAQRWLDYYSSQKAVTIAAVWQDEQPGGAVTLSDPYDDSSIGLIESQDVRLSAKLLQNITIQAGKIPNIAGNSYNHVMVVTQSGQVTIPAEAKGKAQLVLISGGTGGSSGYAGEVKTGREESNNTYSRQKYYLPPGASAGGKAGDPGGGARILRITISVTTGHIFTVVLGAGGAGGLFSNGENSPGQPGGDTTVDGYTTANSQPTQTGYYDPINKVLYGAPGGSGVPGGAGGGYDSSLSDLGSVNTTIPSESVSGFGQTFSGGASIGVAQRIISESGYFNSGYGSKTAIAYGSYGGGAAYGNNGTAGNLDGTVRTSSDTAYAKSAPGGPGADALPPPVPPVRGTGGYGGNGGGGAGACGVARIENHLGPDASPAPNFSVSGNSMTPGKGSDGGRGADGVLLIYY